jgi:hypothetical protein
MTTRFLTALAAVLLLVSSPALAAPSPLDEGEMASWGDPGGLVIAAPHGGFDLYSDAVARQAAMFAGAACVLASGYRTRERPWNVNRPTAGVGLRADAEVRDAGAEAVYQAWAGRVSALQPALYAEIHGNSRPESAHAIEVAVQGISPEDAAWFKRDFAKRVKAMPAGVPLVWMKVEGLDELHYHGESVKGQGVFMLVGKAVQLELPYAVRADEVVRGRYAFAIAQSLRGLEARAQRAKKLSACSRSFADSAGCRSATSVRPVGSACRS